jgi:hypothetical protein
MMAEGDDYDPQAASIRLGPKAPPASPTTGSAPADYDPQAASARLGDKGPLSTSFNQVPRTGSEGSLWDAGLRGLGLGARAVAEGVTGVVGGVGDVLTYPGRAIAKAVGYQPPAELPWMKDLTVAPSTQIGQAIDATGLPKPATPTEQNVSTVVRGAAGVTPALFGAPTVANAARLLMQGGGGALAGEKAAESPLVPDALKPSVNLLASFLGGKVADVTANLGIKTANAVAGNMSPTYNAFQRAGVEPRLLGTVAGGTAGQSAEAALSRVPFASSVIRPVQQQTLDQFGNSVDRTATQLDPSRASATAQTTGDVLQNSYRNWVDNVFNGPQGRQATAWAPLNQRMAGSAVDQAPFRAALDNAANPPNLASLPATQRAFSSPQARAWLDALNKDIPPGGNLSWEQAQAIRSRIGDAMGTPDLVAGIGMQNLKNIYGGLARGMETTATQHGQGQLFSDANAVTTAGHSFIDNVGSKIAKANNPAQETIDPETATRNILNGGDTTLQAVRAELPDAADVLAAHKLRQASTAKPSVATQYDDTSTGTFLTNVNRMRQDRPGGYSALFGDPSVQQQLEDLSTVAGRLRATERHLNTSGTAEQLGWMQYLQGIAEHAGKGEYGKAIGAAVVPPIVGVGGGRLMTSQLATRLAAARGGGTPILPPGRAGLLGDVANLTGQ